MLCMRKRSSPDTQSLGVLISASRTIKSKFVVYMLLCSLTFHCFYKIPEIINLIKGVFWLMVSVHRGRGVGPIALGLCSTLWLRHMAKGVCLLHDIQTAGKKKKKKGKKKGKERGYSANIPLKGMPLTFFH